MKIDEISVGVTDYSDTDRPTTWYGIAEFVGWYGDEEDPQDTKKALKCAKHLNNDLTKAQVKELSQLLTFVWECGRTNGYNSY